MYTLKISFNLLFLISITTISFGQADSIERRFFNNDSIHFEILFISPGVGLDYNPPTAMNYISILLAPGEREFLRKKPLSFWMDHLRNDSSDWATNLVLHHLLMKDATPFTISYKSRAEWLLFKEKTINFGRSI